MKILHKISLLVFPYLLAGVSLLLLYNGYSWLFFMVLLIAFFAWAMVAADLQRLRIIEYMEGQRKAEAGDLKASKKAVDKILEKSKDWGTWKEL